MITYEQDPDVVRWGLQLFDSDPYSNCGYLGPAIQQHSEDDDDFDYSQFQFDKEGNYNSDSDSINVESDEVIAHALQEELSQLAMLENEPLQQQQVLDHDLQVNANAGFLQDWPDSVGNNYGSGECDEVCAFSIG